MKQPSLVFSFSLHLLDDWLALHFQFHPFVSYAFCHTHMKFYCIDGLTSWPPVHQTVFLLSSTYWSVWSDKGTQEVFVSPHWRVFSTSIIIDLVLLVLYEVKRVPQKIQIIPADGNCALQDYGNQGDAGSMFYERRQSILGSVADLHAVDAQYHHDCITSFVN